MENEIVKVEEGQLIVAKDVVKAIKEIENQKKQLDNLQKKYKEQILAKMDEYDIKGYESNDRALKITRTPATTVTKFDEKRFCEEHRDLYVEYQKDIDRKSSLRVTVREEKENE